MKRVPVVAAIAILMFTGAALAADRTVTLKVERMTCFTCPITVKKALVRVPGVQAAEVSFRSKRAVVTFDDAQTDVAALTDATFRAGFPSRRID